MTLLQILYALTIYETGQFSKAADKLFVTQPSLTKAMNELEKELDITIFIRSRKGVLITDEGKEFLIYARQLYAQYELINDRFKHKNNIKKKFSISCQHYYFAVSAFVETIKQFDNSKYEFTIRETKTVDVICDVGNLRSEMGIIFISDFNVKFIEKLLAENDLVFNKLIECRAYAYMSRKNPLADRAYVTFEDLKSYPCISFEQGEDSPYFFSEEILPLNDYTEIVKTNDKLTMLELISELNGFTFYSGIVREETEVSDYISVPFKFRDSDMDIVIQIGYIVKKNYSLSEIGKIYLQNVRNYLENYK